MLNGTKVTAMLPVVDMARARKFYEETLQLPQPRVRPNGEALFEVSGERFALYPRETPTRADHTALSFEVDDLDGEMRALRGRGVRFEEYDTPGLRTKNGVAEHGEERAAWFRDPDGNILCLHQERH
jgi:catechol 2,3-dioxygenase-like lactoylglutathione lyase family enzyme